MYNVINPVIVFGDCLYFLPLSGSLSVCKCLFFFLQKAAGSCSCLELPEFAQADRHHQHCCSTDCIKNVSRQKTQVCWEESLPREPGKSGNNLHSPSSPGEGIEFTTCFYHLMSTFSFASVSDRGRVFREEPARLHDNLASDFTLTSYRIVLQSHELVVLSLNLIVRDCFASCCIYLLLCCFSSSNQKNILLVFHNVFIHLQDLGSDWKCPAIRIIWEEEE